MSAEPEIKKSLVIRRGVEPRVMTSVTPPRGEPLASDVLWVDGKPDVDALREHLFHEGRLHSEDVIRLMRTAQDLFTSDPNVLTIEAPIASFVFFRFFLLLFVLDLVFLFLFLVFCFFFFCFFSLDENLFLIFSIFIHSSFFFLDFFFLDLFIDFFSPFSLHSPPPFSFSTLPSYQPSLWRHPRSIL